MRAARQCREGYPAHRVRPQRRLMDRTEVRGNHVDGPTDPSPQAVRGVWTALPVRAVLFDLDGTLIDTESQTDEAVTVVAARHGVAGFSLPHSETRGRTWTHVADMTRTLTGIDVPTAALAGAMLAYWNEAVKQAKALPGAQQAIRAAAAAGLKVAVVSSSPRSVINHFVVQLGVADCVAVPARIGADSVSQGKPDPEGFLMAARVLESDPATTLVFEDSRAGLLAARAAGMRSIFITCCATEVSENTALATASCIDYERLPPRFWEEIAAGPVDLDNRSFA
jgi:sugar-phosphatase